MEEILKSKYISDELIKTIDMIAQARDKELSFDKTIIAEIVKLNNAETGEYIIKYQGAQMKAYTSSMLSYVFDEGSNVYVKIPQGNFNNKKIIEGRSTSNSLQEAEYDYLATSLSEMGYGYQSDESTEYILNPSEKFSSTSIYLTENLKEDIGFTTLFNSYPNIKITADFKTELGKTVYDNFGIEVIFYCKENNGSYTEFTRKLDKNNFVGNLNSYSVYSPQYAYYEFDIETVQLVGIKSIKFFREHTAPNIDSGSVYVKNIKISFVDVQNEMDSMYFIGVKSLKGLSLTNAQDQIELEGIFCYAGTNILDSESCKVYWFERSPEVTSSHADYNEIAGVGWKSYNNNILRRYLDNELTYEETLTYISKEDEKAYIIEKNKLMELEKIKQEYFDNIEALDQNDQDYTVQLNKLKENYLNDTADFQVVFQTQLNNNKLLLKGLDVYQQLFLKFVVVYNNTRVFSKEVKVIRNYSNRFSIIKNIQNSRTYLKLLDSYSTESEITANWYVEKANGNYYLYDTKSTEIDITNFLTENLVNFYLAITLENNKIIVLNYVLKTIQNLGFNIDFSGSGLGLFLYDKEGKLKSKQTIDYIINPVIMSSDVSKIKITWYSPEGKILTESGLTEDGSMLDQMRVLGNSVYFRLKSQYNTSQTNNVFKLIVEQGNKTYTYTKEIQINKEGDSSLTGTNYELIVQPCDENGGELSFNILYYSKSSNMWNPIYVKPLIYCNGQLIYDNYRQNNISYKISYKLQSINVTSTKVKEINSIPIIKLNRLEEIKNQNDYQGQYFINFIATIQTYQNEADGNSNNAIKTSEKILYTYYPITVLVGDLALKDFTEINMLNYIKYNSSGTNPQCGDTLKIVHSSNIYPTRPGHVTLSSLNNNLIVNYNSEASKYEVKAITKFSGAKFPTSITNLSSLNDKMKNEVFFTEASGNIPMGSLCVDFKTKGYLIQPVVMILESLPNDTIQGYLGQQIKDFSSIGGGIGQMLDENGQFSGLLYGEQIIYNEDNPEESTTTVGLHLFNDYGDSSVSITNDGAIYLGGERIFSINANGALEFGDTFINALRGQLRI